MALSDRDIIITPNRGASSEPIITLRGADAASSASMVMRVINSGTVSTLSFEGTSGQLFAVSDTLSGSIFSVNDVSGIPSIEVLDTGDIKLAEWNGKVRVGGTNNNENATSATTGELQVIGGVGVSRDVYVAGGMTVVGTLNAAVVTGTISNSANATNAANVAVTNDPSSGSTMYPTFVSATSGNQAIRVDGTGLVWVPSTNRLGIGTTAPGANVHIFSSTPSGVTSVPTNTDLLIDSSTNSYLTFRQSADIGAYGGIQWADNNVGAYILFRNFTASGTAVGSDSLIYGTYQDHIFQAGTSGTVNGKTEVMRITQAGNVGIGDTTPTEKLVVAGSAVITGGVYGSETGAPDARIWSVSPANPTWGIFYNEGTPDFIEYKAGGTVTSRIALDTGAAHFGISGGGFVGIGTDAPDIKLDVRGTDTVIQAREDGTSSAWRARVLSRNSSANKAAFLGTYASIPGVFAHNYALSAWAPLYVNTTNGSTDGDNVIIAGSGNVGIGNNAPGRKLDVTGVTNISSHITQGTLISRPNVSWGASGTSTGAVVIKFPGGSGNYGMVHIVIDVYTYDGENASTIIVGGHNWNGSWYNFGASRIGAFSKGVRVAFKDGQYAVVLGTNTSTWSYGQVVVRKIQNGSYYSGVMDLGGTYTITQDAAAESYSYISSNLITTGSAGGGGWNSGNDGSGSGLDADLLDGLDSTSFLRRDVTNTMFAGQTSSLAFENQSTFFRFAFNELRFWDNQVGDIFGLDEHAYATTSMRAPIFYDRNDTTYYLDPASSGKALLVNGNIELTARSESWAEGIRINVPTAGTWGGIRINRSGASGPGNWAIGYTGLNSTNDLTFYSGTTNTIQVNLDHSANLSSIGSMRAPIFYDSNDTTYYLDPNADLSLRVYGEISNSNYAVGNLQPGALNIGRTDTNYNWGGSWSGDVRVGILANCADNWEFAIHDSGTRVVSPFAFFGGGNHYLEMGRDIGWGTMPIIATNSFRAPIFYDQNNTGYYVDPASTTNVNNLTVNGTLTYTGTISAGVDYARRIDNASRTAISVGGNASTYYPVVLQIGAGATSQQYGEFVIERGGYDDPGYTGVNFSTFNMRMSVKASGWGFGSTYENCEALYQNVQLVANWQQVSESSRLIIWLRGATVYYLWNVVGNTTLVNANAAGGNIVETNPAYYTYTFTPTTTIQPKAQHSKYFNSGAFFDGNTRAFSLGVGTNASGTDGRLDVSSNVRAPIYYDLNDTTYYVDPASGSRLSRFLTINGGQTGIYGNELVVGNTAVSYSLEDGNQRPIIQAHGQYPVLSLNHTVTSNGSHGPTVQFTANGTGNQFVIGMNGTGTRLDIGTATGNSWNPHNGIDNYLGTTGWRMDTSGNVNHLVSTRSPIYYDYNDTAYYLDPNSSSNLWKPTSATRERWNAPWRAVDDGNWRPNQTSDSNYWTGTQGWSTNYGNWDAAWKYGYTGLDIWGSSTGHPQGSGYVHAQGIQSGMHYATSDGSSAYGWQMVGAGDAANRWWLRGKWGGTTRAWYEIATYGNAISSPLYASIYYDADDTGYYTDPASTTRLNRLYINPRNDNYYVGSMNSVNAVSDWQSLTNTTGQWTVSQFNAIGNYSNSPGSVYTYGSVMSWRTENHSFQLYAAHTGDLAYKTQWNNDNYSGWLYPMVYGRSTGAGAVYGTIYYDANDTAYYVDPNSSSRFAGSISISQNNATGGGIIFADDGDIVDLNDAYCSMRFSYGVRIFSANKGGSAVHTLHSDGNAYFNTSARSPIFYDNNNTAFYVDPAGYSKLAQLEINRGHGDCRIQLKYQHDGTDTNANSGSLTMWVSEPGITYDCAGIGANINVSGQYYGRQNSGNPWGVYLRFDVNQGYSEFWSTTGTVGTAGGQGSRRAFIDQNGAFYSNSEITAYYSDSRLKTRVGTLDNAVDKVKSIETFKYVNNELANSLGFTDTDVHVGVSAQSVEAVLPEIVKHAPFDMRTGENGTESISGEWYKTVQYDKLVPLLIEAIKEQQSTIEQMRTELDELRELKELVKQSLGK